MKTIVVFFSLLVCFATTQVSAQEKLSKAEKSKWSKKAKELSKKPQMLKQLMEEKELCAEELDSLNAHLTQLHTQIGEKDTRIANLDGQLARMRNDLALAQAEVAQLRERAPQQQNMQSNAVSQQPNQDFGAGVIFRVQIGAFRNKDLSRFFDNNPNFFGEAAEKGDQKATIGVFRDYKEADQFKKYMRAMGVHDAWIVPYKDGQRVPLRDVIGSVTGQDS